MHLSLFLAILGCTDAAAGGEFVSYPSGKEQVRGFLCRPVGDGPFPAVMIVHGDYGLGEQEKQLARRLAGRSGAAAG